MNSCDICLVLFMFSLCSFNLTYNKFAHVIFVLYSEIFDSENPIFSERVHLVQKLLAKFYQRSGKLNQLNQNHVMQTEKKTPVFVFIYFIIRKPFLYSRILCQKLLKMIPILSIVSRPFSTLSIRILQLVPVALCRHSNIYS